MTGRSSNARSNAIDLLTGRYDVATVSCIISHDPPMPAQTGERDRFSSTYMLIFSPGSGTVQLHLSYTLFNTLVVIQELEGEQSQSGSL